MVGETALPLPQFDHDWETNVPYVFDGLTIVIEYLAGDVRTKVTDAGVSVSGEMPCAYGEILGTTDRIGEKIDMYLASMPDYNAYIYVIDQVVPGANHFDEHKVMLGFSSVEEAKHVYTLVFKDGSGPTRIGAITEFSPSAFHQWLRLDGSSLSPASRYDNEGVTVSHEVGVIPPGKQVQTPKPLIDEAGGVLISLPDLSKGPKLITSPSPDGGFIYHLYFYSALIEEKWSTAVDTLCRTLYLAGAGDEMHIHIASPGGSVCLMGRIVSAMRATKAKIVTYAEGEVASAAMTIWSMGHERHILPGAYFMQHMSTQSIFDKTNAIMAKATFCLNYIHQQIKRLGEIGLFTEEEIAHIVETSADVFVSGREAIARVGAVSQG
jgi:ATP-dependent protease ClpP protease subunit